MIRNVNEHKQKSKRERKNQNDEKGKQVKNW